MIEIKQVKQIKIFNCSTTDEAQRQANNFLLNNPDLEIKDISISGQGSKTGYAGTTHITVLIVYLKEIKPVISYE